MPFIIPSCKGLASIIFYFGSLGLAYMFLEISILQQFIRHFYDPIFSASVVIGSFLVYSGIGSLIAGNVSPIKSRHIFWSVLAIGLVCIIFITADRWLHNVLAGLPLSLRMISCSLLIAPLAIPMGIPFPSGLSTLSTERGGYRLGVEHKRFLFRYRKFGGSVNRHQLGFKSIILIAVSLYIVAAFLFSRLLRIVPSLGGRN